jgi:hypothetical protein
MITYELPLAVFYCQRKPLGSSAAVLTQTDSKLADSRKRQLDLDLDNHPPPIPGELQKIVALIVLHESTNFPQQYLSEPQSVSMCELTEICCIISSELCA